MNCLKRGQPGSILGKQCTDISGAGTVSIRLEPLKDKILKQMSSEESWITPTSMIKYIKITQHNIIPSTECVAEILRDFSI